MRMCERVSDAQPVLICRLVQPSELVLEYDDGKPSIRTRTGFRIQDQPRSATNLWRSLVIEEWGEEPLRQSTEIVYARVQPEQ